MRHLFLSLLFLAAGFASFAQPEKNPTHSLTFTLTQGDGTNGASVAYNPSKKIYYCIIAGNASFPLEAFSKNENVYAGTAGFDARGLWYNEKENTLEGNAYDGTGIYSIPLDSKGLPSGEAEYKYPGGQPNAQAVGVYDAATGTLLYFDKDNEQVIRYKRASGKAGKSLKLKGCPADYDNICPAMIYTGVKGYEFGIYDFVDAKVYFFDKKGNYTETSVMGDDAPYNELFNFSYANGYVFLFDTGMKEWLGYKIF